jgi:CBS domain-containing protein
MYPLLPPGAPGPTTGIPVVCLTTAQSISGGRQVKTVKDILRAKGSVVWSVKPDESVFEALKLMAEKDVGGLVVMNGDHLAGIITERDYARKVIIEGRSSKETPVTDVMTKKVLCVTPERTVDECLALMTEKRLRHLPVLEDKNVIGIVSIGDLVKAIIEEQRLLIDQLQQYITS